MTDAEHAYATAQRLIEEAREHGDDILVLDIEECRALEVLPPEIASLHELAFLNLSNTGVSDVTPLSGLSGLGTLDLTNTCVSDVTPLSGLSGLGTLDLTYTGISDVTPLSGLSGLERLSLDNTGVSDVTPLSGLHGLEALDLTNTGVSDVTRLTGLRGLEWLFLGNTGVSDVMPLSALSGLKRLYLDNTGVSDVAPLSGLSGLVVLSLSDNGVSDVTPLSGLISLELLYLHNTGVSDVTPLSGLSGLEALSLTNTEVVDLRPIRGLEKLKEESPFSGLRFSDCAATKIDPEIARISEIEDDAERAHTLFDYLEDWVPPVDSSALPDQTVDGFQVAVADGMLGLAAAPPVFDADLVEELREQLEQVLQECPGQGYDRVRRIVGKYDAALCAEESFKPAKLWNAGNRLRLELKEDAGRAGLALDDVPKLPGGMRLELEALVALHNVFVDGHEDLRRLDQKRQDTLDRHEPQADLARRDEMLVLMSAQTRVIVQELLDEFNTLHGYAVGEDAFAVRAQGVERDSLSNLVNAAVREALREQKQAGKSDGGVLKVVADSAVENAVGIVLPGAAKMVATNFSQLLLVLQPVLPGLLASWHGADYPVAQALEYIFHRMRQGGEE